MKKTALITALLAAVTAPAHAGGLWLNQYGDFASGRSSAGTAGGTDDAAAIIHNPAAATRIQGSQVFGSVGVIIPDIEFDLEYTSPINGTDNGGSAGLNAPVASFAYTNDLGSDRWNVGLSMAGLAGAGLEYNREWAGRFQNTEVELQVLALAPNVAYRVNRNFSLGLALQYYYSTLDFEIALPGLPNREAGRGTLDGSDDGFTFALGALYEFTDRTRLGIRYQHEIDADFDGKLKVKGDILDISVDSDTNLTMASLVRLGLYHQLDDQWALGVTMGWDDWSALDNVFVSLPEREAPLEKNWDDTYHYAVGLEYAANKNWDFTGGIAYDTNPVSAHDRTADLPVDRQVRYTGGARYQWRDNISIGGYLNYTDLGKARISGERWGGKYEDNQVLEFSVFFTWTL